MILVRFILGFFAIFISPQIFVNYKYPNLPKSLTLVLGLIISFSFAWFLFLIKFIFNLKPIFVLSTILVVLVFSIYIQFKNMQNKYYSSNILLWVFAIIILIPLLLRWGEGFLAWDAVVSWNRWALELSRNKYHPYNSAYPILFPAIWSIFYNLQGTSNIWWTARISLFIVPVSTLVLLFSLYKESGDKVYLISSVLIYPYLIWHMAVNGYMDIPVMLFGFISLTMIYTAEKNRKKDHFDLYLYAGIIFGGIASIVKQPGLIFWVFALLYAFKNIKLIKNKKSFIKILIFSSIFLISFLFIFYMFRNNAVGNFSHLKSLTNKRIYNNKNLYTSISLLLQTYFSYPLFAKSISPVLTIICLFIFTMKPNKKRNFFEVLLLIFWLLGFIIWAIYFSYDFRNSLWTRAFLIIFLSINLAYLFEIDLSKKLEKVVYYIAVVLFFSSILLSFLVGNNFAYKIQKQSQARLGNKKVALFIKQFVRKRGGKVLVVSHIQTLKYNFFLNSPDVKNKVKFIRYIDNSFINKRTYKKFDYLIFRPCLSMKKIKKRKDWMLLQRLIKSKVLKRIGVGHYLVYKIVKE